MALVCTKTEYVANGACFTQKNFNAHEQRCILVYRMAQFADAILGSPNYAVSPYTSLSTDSNSALNGLSRDQLVAAEIGVWNVTLTSGTNLGTLAATKASLTSDTAATAIACLKNYKEEQIERMRIYLQCYIFALMTL